MPQTLSEFRLVRFPRAALALVLGSVLTRAAAAQEPLVKFDREQPSTITIDAATFGDLPATDSLFALLETSQPSIISDRFSAGGLSLGQPSRISGFFGSWSQTVLRIGDVTITDPSGNGFPLAFPDLLPWKRVSVATGWMRADVNALGLAVTLDPIEPTTEWKRTLDVSTSHGGMNGAAQPIGAAPAITRLGGWDHFGFALTGPIVAGKLGGAFTGSWSRNTEFIRGETTDVDAISGSGTASIVYTPGERDRVHAFSWFAGTKAPFTLRSPFGLPETEDATRTVHAQASWDRSGSTLNWHTFGGYTDLRRHSPDELGTATFERLFQGPLDQVARLGTHSVRQWSVGTRVAPINASGIRRNLDIGFEVAGARGASSSGFSGSVGELIDGMPARIWEYTQPGAESLRHETSFGAYIQDHFPLTRRLTLDAALRYDAASGSARGASEGIGWQTLLPKVGVRWAAEGGWRTEMYIGVGRRAYRMPLDLLAVGDPAAPTANIYRWDATGADPSFEFKGPLVARVGPGTGGNPAFVSVDPDLKRPYVDEFVVGLHAHPRSDLLVRVDGVARRQRHSFGLVNVGVSLADYTVIEIPDKGSDEGLPDDDRVLEVYNRTPGSFGKDQYFLTNPDQKDAWSTSIELGAQLTRARYAVLVGASASFTEGVAAQRGYGPLENDASLVGETFASPNAAEYARGRLFSDRGLTGKVAGIVHLPWDMRLGILARYQDGQMFSRVLVMPGLNQGTDYVRAFTNGGSLFHFIGTCDFRLQKTFTTGRVRVAGVFDAFLPLGPAFEVEENITTTDKYRHITAVAPPHRLRLGVRLGF